MLFQPGLPDFVFSLQILYQLFTIHSTDIYFVPTRLSWFYRISCIYLICLIQPDFKFCTHSNVFSFKFLQIQISSISDVQNSITPNSTLMSKLNFKHNYSLQLQTQTQFLTSSSSPGWACPSSASACFFYFHFKCNFMLRFFILNPL